MQVLGLCVAALTVATCTGYLAGNQYTFEVEGEILHEFERKPHQHAGYRFKSHLIAQVNAKSCILEIKDSQSMLVNAPIAEDKEDFKPAPLTELSKPFEIFHQHGVVTSIKVDKEDPLWSVNIKKSVAARFQMNLERINLVKSHDKGNHSHFDNKYYYTVMEDTIRGECGIDYVIDDSENNAIEVTKSVDFMTCKAHTYRWYTNQNFDSCFECGRHIHYPMQISEMSHYKLRGDRKQFVLEDMHAEERFIYAPHGMDADYIKGDVKLNMKLIDVKVYEGAITMPDNTVTHNDLHFHFEEPQEINTVDDLKNVPHHFYGFLDAKTEPENAVKLIDYISSIHDDEPYTEIYKNKTMPKLFVQLAYALSSLSYDQLADLDKNHIPNEANEPARHKRMLFLSALIYAGTSSSFMYVKHFITEENLPRHVMMFALGQLPSNLKQFSPPLLEEFYTMCEHPKVHDNMHTRKICYLAFSRLLHEQCVAKYYKIYASYRTTEKILCTPETAEKYFEKMVKRHEGHAKNSLERILCIKTAGNFGTRGSLHYLSKIVHDHHLQNYFRFSAILALDSHTSLYSEEVLSLMMPIYFNESEAHEIRIAAFVTIIESDPKLHHMETIAESLKHEPDHQVAHYVMSLIKRGAEAQSPCYDNLIGIFKRVLRYLKRVDFKVTNDLRHSTLWFSNGYDKKWKMGGSSYLNFITSNQSYVPQSLSFGMEDYKGFKIEYPFEVGYVGYGMDKVFDRVIGLLKQRKSLLGLFRRKARDVNIVEKELKEIDDKLHIDTRVAEPLFADFYIDAFGSEINFFHFNDSTFQSIFKHGANYLGEIMNVLKDVQKYTTKNFITGEQFKFVMPSILGVPIFVDISQAHFVYYRNNNFKFSINPNPLAEGTDDSTPTTINLKIDGHLIHDKGTYLNIGVVLPKIQVVTGAGVTKNIYKSLPLKLKMAVEPSTPKVVVKFTPILPHTVLHKTFVPHTMLFKMKDGFKNRPYYDVNKLKHVEKNFFHDYLGYGVQFKGSFGELHKLSDMGSFWRFMVETDLRQKIYYLSENPLAIANDYSVTLTPSGHDQTSEIDLVMNFDHFGYDTNSDKIYKPDFPTVQDGFENYINSRGDRKPTTCVLKVERVSKGGKERSIVTELGYTKTFDNLYHKFDFHYDRSPFGPDEKDHTKVCTSSSIMFPHVDMKKLYELDTVDMDPKIKVATDIHFGKNCDNDKKVTVRGEMSRTEEHKKMQLNRENPDENCPYTNADAYLYNKCKKDIANGIHYNINCRKYWYRSMKLRHYSIDVHHENFDSKDKYMLKRLDSCFKNAFLLYAEDHPNKELNGTDKFHIDAHFSAKTDHVDVTVRKPLETTEFNNVPHPHWIQARSATPFFEFTNKIKRWSYFRKPFCFVEGDNVHTFDGVLYELPPIDCYKVIAKDCSHKELFTVLGKKVKHNRHSKAVKVFLKKWKIEALPVSEDSEIIVRLNGQAIPVTEAEPYFHYQNLGGKDVLMFSVSFNGLQYIIKSEQLGVTVYYGGTAIVVNLNPYYRGKQCGICGDFNNNDLKEFVGPRNCVYHNATDFGYSYAIPEDGCQVPAVTAPCERHHHS